MAYCGSGKVPKGKKLGTMKECVEKKKIGLYGLNKIDPKLMDSIKEEKVKKTYIPETREKLITMMLTLKGTINRNKGRYEGANNDNPSKDSYHKDWQDAEKSLVKVTAKLQKLKNAKDKEDAKTAKALAKKEKDEAKAKAKKEKDDAKAKAKKEKDDVKAKAKKEKEATKKATVKKVPAPKKEKVVIEKFTLKDTKPKSKPPPKPKKEKVVIEKFTLKDTKPKKSKITKKLTS